MNLDKKRAKLAGMEKQAVTTGWGNLALTMSIRALRAEIKVDKAGGWTSVRDALPPQEEPICGYTRSDSVLVSDGHRISLAYRQEWDDDDQATWYDVGPDAYHVDFDVLYWRALPLFPEIPTGDKNA